MTDERIAEIAEGLTEQPKGTVRAFLAMTGDWQQAGKSTFNWAGAKQAHERLPHLVEHDLRKLGKQRYPRNCYRLNSLGIAVRQHLQERGDG